MVVWVITVKGGEIKLLASINIKVFINLSEIHSVYVEILLKN